jgi:hypothetical protein
MPTFELPKVSVKYDYTSPFLQTQLPQSIKLESKKAEPSKITTTTTQRPLFTMTSLTPVSMPSPSMSMSPEQTKIMLESFSPHQTLVPNIKFDQIKFPGQTMAMLEYPLQSLVPETGYDQFKFLGQDTMSTQELIDAGRIKIELPAPGVSDLPPKMKLSNTDVSLTPYIGINWKKPVTMEDQKKIADLGFWGLHQREQYEALKKQDPVAAAILAPLYGKGAVETTPGTTAPPPTPTTPTGPVIPISDGYSKWLLPAAGLAGAYFLTRGMGDSRHVRRVYPDEEEDQRRRR